MESKARVMVVDDEQRFRENLVKLLKMRGFTVASAPDGQSALDLLDQEEFDVVLLDVRMPGMDGISTLKRIDGCAKQVEVIILTGHASVDSAVEIMNHGAFDYVLKPCPMDELEAKIISALEKKEQRCRLKGGR